MRNASWDIEWYINLFKSNILFALEDNWKVYLSMIQDYIENDIKNFNNEFETISKKWDEKKIPSFDDEKSVKATILENYVSILKSYLNPEKEILLNETLLNDFDTILLNELQLQMIMLTGIKLIKNSRPESVNNRSGKPVNFGQPVSKNGNHKSKRWRRPWEIWNYYAKQSQKRIQTHKYPHNPLKNNPWNRHVKFLRENPNRLF
jgi:hypothetical protein